MKKNRVKGWHGLAVVALLFCTSCLGPNHATGHLFKWNNTLFENKWGNEAVFFFALPVYALFSIGDVLIFNSIQWWSGNNPISRPETDVKATV